VVLKLQTLRRPYKVISCDCHLWEDVYRLQKQQQLQLPADLFFIPAPEDNSLPNILRGGTEKIAWRLLGNTIRIDKSPQSSIQNGYKH